MKSIILFAVNGIGLGHAIRSTKLAEQLMKYYDANIFFVTYGDAYEYLKSKGYNALYLPPIRLEWGTLGVAIGRTVLSLMFKYSFTFIKHLIYDSKIINKYSPTFLISDSRLSPILISRKLFRTPTILITNQLISYVYKDVPLSKYINRAFKWILPKAWGISDLILIPDMPPPYTISNNNITPALKLIHDRRVCFIGILDDLKLYKNAIKGKEVIYDVYFSISGPKYDRLFFSHSILSVLRKITNYKIVVSLGKLYEKSKFQPMTIGRNIVIYNWIANRLDTLAKSKIVVLRGGQTSILESILLIKPMIVIPAYGQTEQIENGLRVHKLGIGEYVPPEKFKESPHVLIKKIKNIIKHYDYYLDNLKRLRNILIKCGGLSTAIKEIKSLVRDIIL